MKLLDKIQEIFNNYELKPLEFDGFKNIYDYLNNNPEKRPEYETQYNDGYFLKKYRDHISKGHYGFSIGKPIIPVWNEILDKILEICIENDPKFEIQQIKLKFGRICFYVQSSVIEDIHEVEMLIMNKLYDKELIY